ncbi:MAG: GspH/FimT family pseudopilin, partial [Variovorax sp.]
MRVSRGFTLIELMVAIAVVAVLLAMALPSFRGTIRSNRLATTTNEFISSISLARSEAIRSSRGAAVCASTNGTACGGTWNDGWLVWTDVNGNAAIDTGETVVRYVQGHANLSLTASGSATSIVFNGRGGATSTPTFTLRPTSCP